MTNISLRIQGLGKRYRLGGLKPFQTLRDSLMDLVSGRGEKKKKLDFWALRDVSFELKQGEVLGIVGRNGAGKSTLLKLLSRITSPDTGIIEIHGRMGSLLEVGTGFHPELTGRENIFMNGTLLGMNRKEIERKFDEIVAFSGVEEFLDTPVKRYSSGMRVRLGFAVAAHLEPEILVVDEVLAVGDAEFQRKCLGRMNEAASEGRTVLFVSHQLEAIQTLCTRAIWLERGRVAMEGTTVDVVASYMNEILKATDNNSDKSLELRADRTGNGSIKVSSMIINGNDGVSVHTGGKAIISLSLLSYNNKNIGKTLVCKIAIKDNLDRVVTYLSNELTGNILVLNPETKVYCLIEEISLVPGVYVLDVAIYSSGVLCDKLKKAASLIVNPGDFHGAGKSIHNGVFHTKQEWASSDNE